MIVRTAEECNFSKENEIITGPVDTQGSMLIIRMWEWSNKTAK